MRHPGVIGSDALNGDFGCSSAEACPAEAQAYCDAQASCRSFAIDPAWKGKGQAAAAQVYRVGLAGARPNPSWTLWVRQCSNASSRALPPAVVVAPHQTDDDDDDDDDRSPGPDATSTASALPAAWDWRAVNGSNWLNPLHGGAVRDQRATPPSSWGGYYTGDCDACWAFSSMDVMAARIFIRSQQKVKALPATNFLYDCMPGLKHCGYPGDASQAYDFLRTNGAPEDSCTPVAASLGGNAQHCITHQTPCPGICTRATMCRNRTDGQPLGSRDYRGRLYFVESWRFMGNGTSVLEIQTELRTHGPIAAGMCINKAWDEYNLTRGVLRASQGTGCDHINHDVNFVGWGTTVGGLEYWLIRNSFGASWGEGGYFRIERGKNAFLIEQDLRAPMPRWEEPS